jgi:hypothetical protein
MVGCQPRGRNRSLEMDLDLSRFFDAVHLKPAEARRFLWTI